MSTDNSPSSSTESPKDPWDVLSECHLIPQVSLRFNHLSSSGIVPQLATSLFHPRQPNYIAPTQFSTQVPLMAQISPGVWSDGKRNVMSANHPDVSTFLAEARASLKLPAPPSEVIFVLAALAVFYKPGDPVHWLFWSDEKKHITADVVTRISLHQPPLIRSNVAWNGTPEYLSILANHHGSTWRQFFENEDWYPILVPPKTAMPKVPNLRKRKVAPGALREASKSPSVEGELDTEEPASKKFRTKRVRSPEKVPTAKDDNSPEVDLPARVVASPAVSTDSMPLEELTPSDSPQSVENPLPEENPDEKESSPQMRSTRQHRRRKVHAPLPITQQTSDSTTSRDSSNTPADLNAVTTAGDSALPSSTSNTHSRNRSTSYASAGTLVGTSSHGRRSSSVLSTCTAVDTGNISNGKGKRFKDKDIDPAQTLNLEQSDEADNKVEDDVGANEINDDELVGVVTRGRARGKVAESASNTCVSSRPKATFNSTSSRKKSKKSRS
ncbi:hypothetical protein AX17_004539 [Amanita inopinata Kibby_2008]|nr:hypothetical protein AX17_004539 [Amanita inopinata Kibby_2008]